MDQPLSDKLASLTQISQHKLQCILSACGSKLDLIIDPALIKPLERICGVTWLRQHGVDKIYKMDPQLGSTANTVRAYLIPTCLQKYKCVLDQISSVLIQNPSLTDAKCFHIILVPKIMSTYDSILESKGLYDIVKLHSFSWDLFSLDEQLLSLELPFLYKQVFVEQNQSLLSSVAMSLWSLFHVTGRPKCILSLGKKSSSVLDILEVYNESYQRDFVNVENSQEIGALIIMDRDQDYASSLLTPATYSGLLNEIFSINCGYLDLNVKETKIKKGKMKFQPDIEKKKTDKSTVMSLDSFIDNLYGEIKHRHFSEVLSVLSSKAKLLKNEDIKALGIQEMKNFVATKLQQVTLFKQNLVNHVLACETIIEEMNNKFENLTQTECEMLNNRSKKANFTFVDEHFGTDIHIYNSLRLMCLLSLTQGLSYDEYNSLVNKYLLAFGYKFLYIFPNLISAGLLIQPSSPKLSLNISNLSNLSDRLPKWQNGFQNIANKLKQLPQTETGNSPGYVFNGSYVPLIAAVCNTLLTSESLTDVLNKLSPLNDLKVGGAIIDKLKSGIETVNEKLSNMSVNDLEIGSKDAKGILKLLKSDGKLSGGFCIKPRNVLVYVVGGVTYAEVAACNVVQTVTNSKIIIASDCVASGGDIMAANI